MVKHHYTVRVTDGKGFFNEDEFETLEEAESYKAEEESTEGITGTITKYRGD